MTTKKPTKAKTAAKKTDKPKRVYETATSGLSIAKSIAARFGEELMEEEFYDQPSAN